MKKILGIIVFVLAFSLNANAQEKAFKKVDVATEAKANLKSLSDVVKLEPKMSTDILGLFEYKFRALNENPSDENKAELAHIIEMKLRATLSADQMTKIEAKQGLLKKLTN